MNLTLNEYQLHSRETALYSRSLQTIDGLTYSVLALCGEAGELANKLKKAHRSNTTPDRIILADELGDVLWYVASVAHELHMTLEDVAAMNIAKLKERRQQRAIEQHS
jgi:NTP pyrophosphatase (non-canonical NTP hydrolase)